MLMYPDLKPVYAFAPARDGSDLLERELWRAKGIEPILYRSSDDSDHATLYATLAAWRHYITAGDPAAADASAIKEGIGLLAHGDAETLFSRLTPAAEWWPQLAGDRSLRGRSDALGAWLCAKVGDPAMVRACVAMQPSDPRAFQAVLRHVGCDLGLLALVPAGARRDNYLSAGRNRGRRRASPFFVPWQHHVNGQTGSPHAAEANVRRATYR
jgi:hypothetical protein